MAYKFQFGAARLSGSTTFEEAATFEDAVAAASLSASAAVSGHELDIETSANIAGNIDSAGDLTVGTITMTGFAVDADGDTALKSLAIDDGSTIGPDSVTDLITLTSDGDLTFKDGTHDFDIASHDGTNGLKLAGTIVTSTAAELNYVDVSSIGTVEASKAVVVDSNKDAVGFRNLSASAEVAAFSLDLEGGANVAGATVLATAKVSDLTSGRVVLAGTAGELQDSANLAFNGSVLSLAGALSGSSVVHAQGNLTTSGNAAASGSITAGTSFIIGSADLNETDLEKLDGITDGTAAASKALVLDGSKDIAGINDLSAANLSASAAVSGFSLDIENGSNIGGATVLATAKVSDLTSGRVVLAGTSGELEDSANLAFNGSVLSLAGALSGSSVVHAQGNLTTSGNAAASGSITAGTSFIIGSADLNETDLEKLDGITDGTAAASKALVLDGSKDIAGINALSAASLSASAAVSGFSLDLEGGADVLGNTVLRGTVQFAGITADTALSVADDGLFFNDAEDGSVKNVSVGSFMTDIAGAGLTVISNQLAVQGNAVSSVVSGSTLSEGYNFIDATSTGSHGMDLASSPSVGDVVHVKAGAGVSSTNFVEIKVGDLGNHFIDGTEKGVRIESPFGAVSLVYVKANQWRLV